MASDEKIGGLLVGLGLDPAEFNRALKEAQLKLVDLEKTTRSATQSMSESFRKFGKELSSVGRQLTTAITIPLAGIATAATRSEMAFEAYLSKITSLVGVSAEQVGAWRDEVLSLSTAVGKSPKELADALYFATSAGFRGAEAMSILTQASKVASAAQVETKLVVDLATSAMNAYKASGLGAAKAMDVIVNSVRLGKVEFDDLVKSVGIALPVASKLGVSFDQVGASIAAMTRTGTTAETSAVQLRQILSQLIGPSEQAKKAFNQLQWSAQEFREEVAEKGLLAGLTTFTEKIDELGSIEIANDIFGNIRALTGVLDMMGDNVADTIMIFDEMANDSAGRANRAFEVFADTLQFKWNRAMSASNVALIAVGETLKETFGPILIEISNKLIQLTNWWKGLSSEQQNNYLLWLGIAAALGPVLWLVGKMITAIGFLIKVFGALKLAVAATSKAFVVLKAAIVSNPIGALITVVASAAAGFWLYKQKVDSARKANEEFNDVAVVTNEIGQNLYNTLVSQTASIESFAAAFSHAGKVLRGVIDSSSSGPGLEVPIEKFQKSLENLSYKELEHLRDYLEEVLPTAQQNFIRSTDEMEKAQLGRVLGDYAERLRTVQEELKETDRLVNAMNEPKKEKDNSFVRLRNDIAKAFAAMQEMAKVDVEFNPLEAKIELISEKLKELVMGQGKSAGNAQVLYLTQQLEELKAQLQAVQEGEYSIESLETQVAKAFAQIEKYGRIFGETFDVIGEKTEFISKLLEDVGEVFDENSDPVDFLVTHLDALGSELDLVTRQMLSFITASDSMKEAFTAIDTQAKYLDNSFDPLAAKINAVRGQIVALSKDAITNAVALESLKGELQGLIDSMGGEMVDASRQLSRALGSLFVDVLEAVFTPLEQGETMFDRLLVIIASFISQLGSALIQAGVAMLAFQKLQLLPGAAIAVGASMVAFAAVLKSGINSSKNGATAFANGGIAYGPTMGLVGEYPGARTNPEVIAPLSKLKALMGDTNGQFGGDVEFKIHEDYLWGIIEKRMRRQHIYR